MYIRKINKHELDKVKALYLGMSADDKYTRFMHTKKDESIGEYVDSMASPEFVLIGVFDFSETLHGLAEGHIRDGIITGAFAVSSSSRKQGLGKALTDRLLTEGKLAGCKSFHLSCLTSNTPMIKLARKMGMELESEFGETEAYVNLEEPTVSERLNHMGVELVEQAGYSLVELTKAFWTNPLVYSR